MSLTLIDGSIVPLEWRRYEIFLHQLMALSFRLRDALSRVEFFRGPSKTDRVALINGPVVLLE